MSFCYAPLCPVVLKKQPNVPKQNDQPYICSNMALNILHEFWNAQSSQHRTPFSSFCGGWQAPAVGFFKINSDAFIIEPTGTGVGIIIRDNSGMTTRALTK